MTIMLAYLLTKGLPICVFQENVTPMGLLGAYNLCFSGSFAIFMYLVRKAHVFHYYMHILTFVIILLLLDLISSLSFHCIIQIKITFII